MGFQSQLAALMEMLMKAVVCETTKLFESGVLRLRLEVASIRQENEELKARLRSSEKLDTRSRSQKCQKISTSEEGDPGVQLTISEEDNMTKLSPVVALKEEDSEVAFVLVKHEDPNAEECNAGVSIQNSEEKSSIQDMLREATVKKHMTHMTTCDDREELPYEVGGALAEGVQQTGG
ncbi:zinc finger protein 287-like [Arapaima gigas]